MTQPRLLAIIGSGETAPTMTPDHAELFEAIASGALKIRIDSEIPLRDAKKAHELLESRKTVGKVLLIP